MITTKVMTVEEFMDSSLKGDEREIAEKLVKQIWQEKGPYARVAPSVQPLYRCDTRVLCGGDCKLHVCYRAGYGYTCIWVGDRGEWYCRCSHNDSSVELNYTDIVFYDGYYEEVYTAILKHVR